LFLRYEPFQNRLYYGARASTDAHAAWVLARAHAQLGGRLLEEASRKTIAHSLRAVQGSAEVLRVEEDDWDPATLASVALLLLALCRLPRVDDRRERARGLSQTLWMSIDIHGRVSTRRSRADSADAFQDEVPGQVLLSLAMASEAGLTEKREDRLSRAFRYYRHRFRYKRSLGQVSWLMQAFSAWWRVTAEHSWAEFVFDVGDWILEYQQEKSGAFITDHQPDTPGYTTALYLSGLGAGARLAAALGARRRHQCYLDACARGLQFLQHLVIQPREASLYSDPEFAIGGVRRSYDRSEIQVDFVLHSLSAILELNGFDACLRDVVAAPDSTKSEETGHQTRLVTTCLQRALPLERPDDLR
jgi:hypothetical protein